MALRTHGVYGLIFDLDDTLFDTYGQLVRPASREACQAMIHAGLNANLDQALKAREEIFLKDPRTNLYEKLVEEFDVKEGTQKNDVVAAGFNAFHNRKIKEDISLFSDAADTLLALAKKYDLYLVTLGAVNTQERKIETLDLRKYFKEVFVADVSRTRRKSDIFRTILKKTQKPAGQFISIGNRIDGEIHDGKELGMQTILMLHGEYAHLNPQNALETPDAEIRRLSELKEILL